MPRVVILARHYWPDPGAATNRLCSLVSAMTSQSWDVTVVTRVTSAQVDGSTRDIGPCGEKILRVAGDTTSGVSWRRAWDLTSFPVRAIRIARESIDSADVLICDPPPTVAAAASALARSWNAKLCYYFADSWSELLAASSSQIGRIASSPVKALERYALRRADAVFAVTHQLSRQASRLNQRVSLVPNGVDGTVYTSVGSKNNDFVFPDSLPYFLYAGNFGEAHGAAIFADAAELIWRENRRTFGLVFAGYGSDAPRLRRLVDRWPDRAKLIPPVEPEMVTAGLRGALGGLASVKNHPRLSHAIPVKALAAIMCGAPVVFAGEGDFSEVVKNQAYGIVCDRDPRSIANALCAISESPWSPERRHALSGRARKNYDSRDHSQQLFEQIRAMLEESATQRAGVEALAPSSKSALPAKDRVGRPREDQEIA